MYWVHVTFSCTYIAFSKSLKKDGVSRSSSSESSKSMSRSLCRSSEIEYETDDNLKQFVTKNSYHEKSSFEITNCMVKHVINFYNAAFHF